MRSIIGNGLPNLVPNDISIISTHSITQTLVTTTRRNQHNRHCLTTNHRVAVHRLMPILNRVTKIGAPSHRLPLLLLCALTTIRRLCTHLANGPVLLDVTALHLVVQRRCHARFGRHGDRRRLNLAFQSLRLAVASAIT